VVKFNRHPFAASLAGFIIASAICAAAPNVPVLNAARAVQGLAVNDHKTRTVCVSDLRFLRLPHPPPGNGKLMIEPVRLDSSDRHEKVKLPVFCRAFFLACGLRRG